MNQELYYIGRIAADVVNAIHVGYNFNLASTSRLFYIINIFHFLCRLRRLCRCCWRLAIAVFHFIFIELDGRFSISFFVIPNGFGFLFSDSRPASVLSAWPLF